MRKNKQGSRLGAMVGRPIDSALPALRWVSAVVAVLMSLAIPGRCFAQSLNLTLPPVSSYGIFANGGQLNVSFSAINGNVEIGKNSPNPNISWSIINGSTNSDISPVQTTLPTANQTFNYANGINASGFTNFNGSAGVNVFNINGNFNASGILSFNGQATDTFIFVVNGSSGLNFSGVTMDLTGGLLASHVLFDVVKGNAKLSNISSADGTFYTQSGSIEVSNLSSVTGALVAGGGGNISVTALSGVSADPFLGSADPSLVSAAPEMPTIMTAGLAAFLIMGSSGVSYLRRKRASPPV
jgi:hypothetical protein